MGESLTQAETLVGTQDEPRPTRQLAAVPEEEEESTPGASLAPTQGRSQGRKRRAADEDVEMDDADSRPAKRRADGAASQLDAGPATQAPESSNGRTGSKAPESSGGRTGSKAPEASGGRAGSRAPPSRVFSNASNKGAAPGKPDQDDAFLKAVASTKRGKKHEDEFDREFNNLRISKPDLQREETEKAWAVLDDFGDDSGVRGNFMVVVEMEIFKKEETSRDAVRTHGGRLDWEGRPNHKKFKKVGRISFCTLALILKSLFLQRALGERPKPVEVYISDDEGLGGAYKCITVISHPKLISSLRFMGHEVLSITVAESQGGWVQLQTQAQNTNTTGFRL